MDEYELVTAAAMPSPRARRLFEEEKNADSEQRQRRESEIEILIAQGASPFAPA